MFRDVWSGRVLVREMRALTAEQGLQSLGWVVMPDHLHWLFQLGEPADLAATMRQFKGRSARALNRHLGREGSVWQRAYFDHALREEEDIRDIARYIVANPLRAGLVDRLGDYPLWDAIWL